MEEGGGHQIWVFGCLGRSQVLMGYLCGNILGVDERGLLYVSGMRWEVAAEFCFWLDVWCGECSLQSAFPLLFCSAYNKSAMVADYVCWQNGVPHWDVRLI
jgi:hypothetical protein